MRVDRVTGNVPAPGVVRREERAPGDRRRSGGRDRGELGARLPGVDVREAIGAGRFVAGREVDGRDDGFFVTRLGPPRLTLVALVPIIADADEDTDDDVAVTVLAMRWWDDEQAATVSKTSRADARPTRWRRIPASCRIGARALTRQRSPDGPASQPMAVRSAVCG